jgi:hypothetical protein
LQAPEHLLDYPFKVDAVPGRTMQVQAPGLGGLTIRSAKELCQIAVNGRNLGFPPVNHDSVAAGTYSILLTCPDGETVRGSTVVVAGRTSRERVP